MIRIEGLKKVYRHRGTKVTVFDNLQAEVERGKCLLLVGPSGCGKTTFLNIAGCLTRPTAGKVWIGGKEVSRLPEHFLAQIRRRKIGFVFQQFNLIMGCTALENVGMPLIPEGIGEKERNRRAVRVLEKLALRERAGFKVNHISGGEQQRVAFARALINDPEIILADEPNSNIDEATGQLIIDTLREMKAEGKTIIIASHDRSILESGIADGELVFSQN